LIPTVVRQFLAVTLPAHGCGRHTVMNEFADTCDRCRPSADKDQWQYHLRRDTTVESQENGPFGVVVQIAWSDLLSVSDALV
jgi:hypothetical protein